MGDGVSPDTLASKIVRVETRQEEHRRLLDLTVPLVGQVAVQEQRIDDIKGDVTEGFNSFREELSAIKKEMRDELADIKRDEKSKARERRAMILAIVLAALGLIGNYWLQLQQLKEASGR